MFGLQRGNQVLTQSPHWGGQPLTGCVDRREILSPIAEIIHEHPGVKYESGPTLIPLCGELHGNVWSGLLNLAAFPHMQMNGKDFPAAGNHRQVRLPDSDPQSQKTVHVGRTIHWTPETKLQLKGRRTRQDVDFWTEIHLMRRAHWFNLRSAHLSK